MKKNKKDIPRVLDELNMVFSDNVRYEEFDNFMKEYVKNINPDYKESVYHMENIIRTKCHNDYKMGIKTFDYKCPIKVFINRLLFILLYYYWSKSKEIFDFDEDFFEELIKTPIEEIPIEEIKELPYKTFVCQHGNSYILVHKTKDIGRHPITEEVMNAEFIYLYNVRDGKKQIEFLPIPLIEEFKDVQTVMKYYTNEVGVENALKYINILMYLVSDKGDVAENPKQKAITRRTETVKNTFREVRKWDVGYRFGNVFRKQKNQNVNENNKSKVSRIGVSAGLGTKKRAHIRRGHWHRFWTGKRDSDEQKQIIRWVSPVAVNFEDDDSPAVIHKVK